MKMLQDNKADKPPRTALPGTLLSQWWTVGVMAQDPRLTGRHIKVAWVIIDRYMQVKGDARASARYLQRATGMSSRTVVKACHELTEWGYFTQRLGSGTRPTEFTPKWATVSPVYNAKANEPSVVPMCNASVSPMYNANESSVVPMCYESYLHRPADQPGLLEVEMPDAAPSAPVAAGLAPALPVTAQGEKERSPLSGFDELWSAYGWKQQRVKARAAYTKLSPDTATHSAMVDAAAAWGGHYVEHNTEPRWRVMLHNWIAGEKWKDDLPIVQPDAKSAAISQVRGSAKPKAKGKAEPARVVRIVSVEEVGDFFGDWFLDLKIAAADGSETVRQLHALSARAAYGDGPDKAAFDSLRVATAATDHPSEMVGCSVLMSVAADGSLTFASVGNDHPAAEQAA